MPVVVTKDPTPKVDIPATTKKTMEDICSELFSAIFPKPKVYWSKRDHDTGAEVLLITSGELYARIEYIIRFLDKDTIEFWSNYGQLRSKAKSIEGLKAGLKQMLEIEKSKKEFCEKVFP